MAMRNLAAADVRGLSSPPPNNLFLASAADKITGGMEDVAPSDLERVSELRHSLLERQTVYSYCASYYGKRYYILTIPHIIVTTAISVLGAVWPYDNGDAETAGRIIISVLGALATVITAVLALCRFQSKMDIFYNAAQQIDGMVSRLSFLTKYRMGERLTKGELQIIISGIEDKLNEVRTKVPPIPNELYLAGCKEEDELIEIRNKREQQGSTRKHGWTESTQVAPDLVDGEVPVSPKDGATESVKKQQWC